MPLLGDNSGLSRLNEQIMAPVNIMIGARQFYENRRLNEQKKQNNFWGGMQDSLVDQAADKKAEKEKLEKQQKEAIAKQELEEDFRRRRELENSKLKLTWLVQDMKKYLYEQAQLESDIRVTDFLDSVDPKEILNGKYSVAWKNRQLQISNLEEINNEIENLDIEIRELKELILEN